MQVSTQEPIPELLAHCWSLYSILSSTSSNAATSNNQLTEDSAQLRQVSHWINGSVMLDCTQHSFRWCTCQLPWVQQKLHCSEFTLNSMPLLIHIQSQYLVHLWMLPPPEHIMILRSSARPPSNTPTQPGSVKQLCHQVLQPNFHLPCQHTESPLWKID